MRRAVQAVVVIALSTFAGRALAQEDVTDVPVASPSPTRGEPETVGEPKLEGETAQLLDRAGGMRIGRILLEPLASGLGMVLVAGAGYLVVGQACGGDSGCMFGLGLVVDVGTMFAIAAVTNWVGRAMGGLGGFWYPFLGALISISSVWAADPEVKPVGIIMAPLAAMFLFEMESWFKENGLRNGVLTPRDVAIAPMPIFGPDRRPAGAGLALTTRF